MNAELCITVLAQPVEATVAMKFLNQLRHCLPIA
jgi:hypothetical protein